MLTFDSIRDLERLEKQNRKLQKLPDDIAAQMREYLKRKERIADKTSADITEMENILSTIKRLMEFRESKILTAAMDTVRTGMPPENMTNDEEIVFYSLVEILKKHREKFTHEIHTGTIVTFKVLRSLPAFIGPDMKTYELKEGDQISLPDALAEMLAAQGIVEKSSD